MFWYYWKNPLSSSVTVNHKKIFVEIAITDEEKVRGLSNKSSMPVDHGMLFIMGEPAHHSFWMKDMRFPLDFIWISEKTVVDLTENVPNPKGTEPPVKVQPRIPADKLLEVNAGGIQEYGIKIGDTISFKN